MAAKAIISAMLIICLNLLQIAFLSGLPVPAGNLNLVIVVLIFVLALAGFNYALWWSLGAGLIMEIFSFLPFGAYLLGFSLAAVMANFLLDYFFTNRSLYSFLALTGLAALIYQIVINLIISFFTDYGQLAIFTSANFWLKVLNQILLNSLLTFIIYHLIHFLGRSLKPVFLIKK